MRTPHPVRQRLGRAALAAAGALTLALGVAPAVHAQSAAPPTGAAPAPATAPSTRPLCSAPTGKGAVACLALQRTDRAARAATDAANPAGLSPADLRDAYDLPAGGDGQTVAIVDAYDDPNAEADLAAYRAQYGLPACTTDNGCFRKVDQRGGTDYPQPDTGWAGEIALDLDMVSAACPACHILLVEADGPYLDELGAAVDTAVALGARYVSNSYGGSESPDQTDYDRYYDHPGVAITVSTGDYGYGVSYPASAPHVTAVGGTSLTPAANDRGWTETAWSGAGSGCSAVTPKPAFQHDGGCAKRAVADVSAVADPATGVAVYNTYNAGGWAVFGGTSASAPLVAAGYALGGPASGDEYPNTFPYLSPDALNDVTSGSNGSCDPAYLCTAQQGYDGPTGLGTPHGVAALTQPGPHGTVAGTVSDSATGTPLAGATVTVGSQTATTGADGKYQLGLKVGRYDLAFAAYGYADAGATVAVTDGTTTTRDVALDPVPMTTLAGRVTDGSGHGWPLYAKVTVDGVPSGPWYTDPTTGRYRLQVPAGHEYTVHAAAQADGYQPASETVAVQGKSTTANLSMAVQADRCVAPGYRAGGLYEEFDARNTPTGWTVTNNTDTGGWEFDDPGMKGNRTPGGSGGFAMVNSEFIGYQKPVDTDLTTPDIDLSAVDEPVVRLATEYFAPTWTHSTASIDVSVDGGTSWTSVWSHTSPTVDDTLTIDLPQAAHRSAVRVRFHYTGNYDMWWQLDNLLIGQPSCAPVQGGLVVGQTLDATTGQPIAGSTVRAADAPDAPVHSAATDDPAVDDGWFSVFVPHPGKRSLSAAHGGGYRTDTRSVVVRPDRISTTTFRLTSGRLAVSGTGVSGSGSMSGQAQQSRVSVRNTGTAPVTVQLHERSDGGTLADAPAATAAPKLATTRTSVDHGFLKPSSATATPAGPAADGNGWSPTALYPTGIMDATVGVRDGKLYSFGGFTGAATVNSGYVYDPITMTWSALPKMESARQRGAGGFIDGKFYLTGGWDGGGGEAATTVVYDPATGGWTNAASEPEPYGGSGYAVLHDKLYVVGGCRGLSCGVTDVQVFDPATGRWSKAAPYPMAISWSACGAIGDKLYCAGGQSDHGWYADTYVYDPVYDSWSAVAPMPTGVWGSQYTSANGRLLVTGGVRDGLSAGTVTNASWAYDPASDSWSALPATKYGLYRGSAAPGFYVLGGSTAGQEPRPDGELLAGYDAGSAGDVPWLAATASTVTLKPGQRATITVTLDPTKVAQPGSYSGAIEIGTDGPYHVADLPATLTAAAPASWAKLVGTVQAQRCDGTGSPLYGAYLEIDGDTASFARRTDNDGRYALWIDTKVGPLTVLASKDGYRPAYRTVRPTAGHTTTADFGLKPTASCS